MLSVQGATSGQQVPGVLCHISTHAPRAGSDSFVLLSRSRNFTFQSTLPVRGATETCAYTARYTAKFQSTLPVRGATGRWDLGMGRRYDFNPRSPCGERPLSITGARRTDPYFNPRSPCGERQTGKQAPALTLRFQSTLPVRGATAKMPKTEPFILSNFHNFKKNTDRTRTKVIIKMELWINLSPFSGANRTGNLWSLLLRTLKGS